MADDWQAEAARYREALEDIAWQFAYPGSKDGRLVLSTGGLSALESAFEALGWPDPKPCPERECEAVDCYKEATTGTPTDDGYKRLCFDHYRELSRPTPTLSGQATDPAAREETRG
jgi:hypothetical protein